MEEAFEKIQSEPYIPLLNDCLVKSLKVIRQARSMGKTADLILCITYRPTRLLGLPLPPMPHFYAKVDGRKVDIGHQRQWENFVSGTREATTVLPFNLTRMRPEGVLD